MLSRFAAPAWPLLLLVLPLGACSATQAAPATTPSAVDPSAVDPEPQPGAEKAGNPPAAAQRSPAENASSREELAKFVAPADDEARDVATIQTLEAAKSQFQAFIDRAGDRPEYADAVQRSRERVEDIQAQIDFLNQGIAERKAQSE